VATSFATFILSVSTAALQHLGVRLADDQGAPCLNLSLAKQTISILEMLEKKTEGNLTEEECRLLGTVLYDLPDAISSGLPRNRVLKPSWFNAAGALQLLDRASCCQRPVGSPADRPPGSTGEKPAAVIEADELPSFSAVFSLASPAVVNISAAYSLPSPKSCFPATAKNTARPGPQPRLGISSSTGRAMCLPAPASSKTPTRSRSSWPATGTFGPAWWEATSLGYSRAGHPARVGPAALEAGQLQVVKSGRLGSGLWLLLRPLHTVTAGIVSAIRSAEDMESSSA